MRWDDLRTSENVEDRRGQGGGFGGGGRTSASAAAELGIGTVIVLGLLGWALGIDPAVLIGGAEMVAGRGADAADVRRAPARRPPNDQIGTFVAKILGETEDVWSQVLPQQANRPYEAPRLVLFSGATQSACGGAQSAMGPFYCPIDQKVYLDTAFFRKCSGASAAAAISPTPMSSRTRSGHHVENLLGILPKVQQAQRRAGGGAEANELSVRVELMADCLAGIWANKMNAAPQQHHRADVRQAVAAASAIGDDRLQRQAPGPRRARQLHARLLRAARALADDRPAARATSTAATRSRQRSSSCLLGYESQSRCAIARGRDVCGL